jgi:hypothetical protein
MRCRTERNVGPGLSRAASDGGLPWSVLLPLIRLATDGAALAARIGWLARDSGYVGMDVRDASGTVVWVQP